MNMEQAITLEYAIDRAKAAFAEASDAGPDLRHPATCHNCCGLAESDEMSTCQGAVPDLCTHQVCRVCVHECGATCTHCKLPACCDHVDVDDEGETICHSCRAKERTNIGDTSGEPVKGELCPF